MKTIDTYNKILVSKNYIQITSEELHLSALISLKLRKYNCYANKKNRVKQDLSLTEKLNRLKNIHVKEQKEEIEELVFLIEFKQLFENNGIRENDIKNKINFIKNELERLNEPARLKLQDSNIIYDENKVHIERVDSLVKFTKKLEEYRLIHRNIYYRGQNNLNWPVLPSIFRGKWIEHEKDFIHEMIMSNPQDFVNLKTTLEKLTKMQHYNAPTRLLDLTSNPYIALYFACEENRYPKLPYDGEVIFFQSKEDEKYFDSDTVSIISNLAMMENDFDLGDDTLNVEDFNKQDDCGVPYLLHQIKFENPNFLNLINPTDLHKCFIVHVPFDNKRILNQQGLFLIVGMGETKTEPASIEDSFFKIENKKLIFIVPESSKKKILYELDTMNINKRFVYPEIDDVADFLKHQRYQQ